MSPIHRTKQLKNRRLGRLSVAVFLRKFIAQEHCKQRSHDGASAAFCEDFTSGLLNQLGDLSRSAKMVHKVAIISRLTSSRN